MNGPDLDNNTSGGHLNEDAMLDHLYGVNDHRSHLEHCGECSAQWQDLLERRSRLAPQVEVTNEFLWAQRRKVYSRMGQERSSSVRWAPALAAAALLVIGALVYHPSVPAPKHTETTTDAQIFSEAYSMEQSLEPRAAAPIHALFEDNQ